MKRIALILLLNVVCVSFAQTPASTPPSLDQLEATYRENLMKVQAPLMQQYVKILQAQLDKSPEADKDAIRFEIARVHKLIADGTPIDLTARNAKVDTEEKPGKRRGIIFTLDPEETKPPHAKDSTLALGTAVWPFSKLAAGKYELLGLCACPGPLPASPTVTITYHGTTQTFTVTERNLTKSATNFRTLSLCSFTLTEEVLKEDITVSASGDTPWIYFKQLRLVKARE